MEQPKKTHSFWFHFWWIVILSLLHIELTLVRFRFYACIAWISSKAEREKKQAPHFYLHVLHKHVSAKKRWCWCCCCRCRFDFWLSVMLPIFLTHCHAWEKQIANKDKRPSDRTIKQCNSAKRKKKTPTKNNKNNNVKWHTKRWYKLINHCLLVDLACGLN